jgi:hypothetical protein
MRAERSLDDVLKTLDKQEGLVFILEDWDDGVRVNLNATVEDVRQAITAARSKYGDRFSFRAFNSDVDVWWNGEVGIICDGPVLEEDEKILLEFDWKRHPAMVRFAKALCPNDPKKNLRPFRIKAVLLRSGQGIFWRFIGLAEGGRQNENLP